MVRSRGSKLRVDTDTLKVKFVGKLKKYERQLQANWIASGGVKHIYYIPKLNQAFSLVDSTVQYFPSYCTLPKLNQNA